MQTSLLAEDDLPAGADLAAAVVLRGTPGHFDEWRATLTETAGLALESSVAPPPLQTQSAQSQSQSQSQSRSQPQARAPSREPTAAAGAPAALWRGFFDSLGAAGWADLPARQRGVRHRVREDGVSYNVYADLGEANRPWPLELLPFMLQADEWALIEQGVLQRAQMLSLTLADLNGAQTLLRDALLPAALIFAHPQYLRAAHGLQPVGGTLLHIQAFDIARTPEGGFCVLAQRVQAPSGLGYLLQNRLIIGPQFSTQFAALRVQRLASSFRGLLDGLMRASPAGERSRIALLTPGPHNETYFEQVFLARYLGITLVEGNDLTVRGDRLFLKTLRGLERVHVLLRRVDDEWLDPLELRDDSALGVPGLMQALRAGELVMANAPGAGVLESPGLAAFWPGVAERLLGQDLLLPAGTSWWCGEAAVWASQRERLADYVVLPSYPGSGVLPQVVALLSAAERRALAERIDADPAAYTLQAPTRPSETPVWQDGRLLPRAAVMRVFALADGAGGWQVLPGALTRVAGPGDSGRDAWLSMQHGSASADTWVVARGAVDGTSLLPRALSVSDLEGWHRTVTSRAAENLFWLGRYTERAENVIRLARLMLETLPESSAPVQKLLAELALRHSLIEPDGPTPQSSPRRFQQTLVQTLGDRQMPGSLAQTLASLRSCAQALRERLSPEHWRLIHEIGEHFEQHLSDVMASGVGHAAVPDVLGVLARAATHLAAITGAQTDRMTRDDGWRLLSVGRQIERLEMLSHALARGFEHRVHEADDGFALLLGLFDSVITYRAQFQGRREVLPLLHLLVADTDNPRSLAWVARTMRDRLRKLAQRDTAWLAEVTTGLPTPETWSLAELAETDGKGRHTVLVHALLNCAESARGLSDEISRHLFVHVSSPDRRVWQ